MADADGREQRAKLLEVLLTKVTQDPYPSSTMLDLIEQLMEPDDVPAYVDVLLQKIEGDTYPSVSLMNRLVEVTT
jgi:hypothetical protein